MEKTVLTNLKKYPIIAAVKNEEELNSCLNTKCQMVFILFGDICSIGKIAAAVKSANKLAIVHIDLIGGLSSSDIAIQFISENINIDGIISTKSNLLRTAHEKGLITVQRVFMIDSLALKNIKQHIKHGYADFIEILPGVLPKIIKLISSDSNIPIIAGGLITDREDIKISLEAGAIAVSTSKKNLWII